MFVMLFHQVQGHQSLRTVVMTDVAGFTELMRANEPHTLSLLAADMEVLRTKISQYGGEVIKVSGDGILALFESAPKAVRACIDSQHELSHSSLKHRIAIHAGEVTVSGGDAYGDTVNICARLEAITKPGTVSASKIVIDLIRSQNLPEPSKGGKIQLKGVDFPIEMFSWGDTTRIGKIWRERILGIGGIAAGVAIIGGYIAFTSRAASDQIAKSKGNSHLTSKKQTPGDTSVAVTADEILDQAYDEVLQEIEEYDSVKTKAVEQVDPQRVLDWLKLNPLGQRERGKREIEHWTLVLTAMNKGREIAGSKSTPDEIVQALEKTSDPSLAVAIKAFAEEFKKPK